MILIMIIYLMIGGSLIYIFIRILRSAPYQCPKCGAIMQRADYCQRCGWSMTRHTRK